MKLSRGFRIALAVPVLYGLCLFSVWKPAAAAPTFQAFDVTKAPVVPQLTNVQRAEQALARAQGAPPSPHWASKEAELDYLRGQLDREKKLAARTPAELQAEEAATKQRRAEAARQKAQDALGIVVTKDRYDSLRIGMTMKAAFAILGAGEELSSNAIGGIYTVMFQWKNRDGSNMNAMFQSTDGTLKLITKAQFGLP